MDFFFQKENVISTYRGAKKYFRDMEIKILSRICHQRLFSNLFESKMARFWVRVAVVTRITKADESQHLLERTLPFVQLNKETHIYWSIDVLCYLQSGKGMNPDQRV